MRLFSAKKERAVQSLMLKIVNNHCSELGGLIEGPRSDRRVNLVVVLLIVPVENGRPAVKKAFPAVTKEASLTGVAVVLNEPLGLDEVLLGFRWESEMKWVRATAVHLSPMGAGFYQLGFRLVDVMHAGDYPELESLRF